MWDCSRKTNVIGGYCVARSLVHPSYYIHSRVELCSSVFVNAYKSMDTCLSKVYLYIVSVLQHSIKTGWSTHHKVFNNSQTDF